MIQDDAFASPLTKAPQTLDLMSIDELEAKVVQLKEEIAACERMIEMKRAQRAAADAVFGGRPS